MSKVLGTLPKIFCGLELASFCQAGEILLFVWIWLELT